MVDPRTQLASMHLSPAEVFIHVSLPAITLRVKPGLNTTLLDSNQDLACAVIENIGNYHKSKAQIIGHKPVQGVCTIFWSSVYYSKLGTGGTSIQVVKAIL